MSERKKRSELFRPLSFREAGDKAGNLERRWLQLIDRYLPVKSENSIWRGNRSAQPGNPSQGWKLHLSATILEACDLFERVVPILNAAGVQYKAPNSLEELSKINSGIYYGYHQIGKFITIYPATEREALKLAAKLHLMTKEFFPLNIPFNEQYTPGSSLFYRYGGFSRIETIDENGKSFLAIKNPAGAMVPDNRKEIHPEWISTPFPKKRDCRQKTFQGTPLGTTYRIFKALKQRGKGGIYQALDFSSRNPRLCVVKEGRRNGELAWNGQDGFFLAQNEFEVLKSLSQNYREAPQILDYFQINDNFYFVMEYLEGISLDDFIKPRRRRLRVRQVLELAIATAKVIEEIHEAGWVWNDCKPANLIMTKNKNLRPIDFEGAYPIGKAEPFDWKSQGFSRNLSGVSHDIYALGAVVYFLLTGRLYDFKKPIPLEKLRRRVPPRLVEITGRLLSESDLSAGQIRKEFAEMLERS